MGEIRTASANPASLAPEPTEPPLVETKAYGVSGLVLWLAADSGVTTDEKDNVIALEDRTRNFTLKPAGPNQAPIYIRNGLNGKPVLRFNGNQSLYSAQDFGTALNRDMTFITVAMTNGATDLEQFPLYLGQNATPHVNRALPYFNGKLFFDGQFVGCYGEPMVANAFVMEGASIDSSLTQVTFYRNGKQMTVSNVDNENKNQNRSVVFEDLSNGVTMGAAADPVCGWQGDIAEELVYDHQLSPAEMQLVWVYLSAKYDLHQAATAESTATVSAVKPSSSKL